ncbi:MAG TPA: peptidyl-arginine deiminase [Bacteroidales bacterium]|nr:MAG: hypothetical protein A2X11_01310 [Bacteroidetes bacterium GWE2_42_24]OFY27336.1 MAG: hypothetical protein A2X09_00520 [Bacteroidetes bacterium GWF2_43_11]HAQ65042.1 peptidyl-arginine deiminase [Bacteroidales bacterium]HBZ65918.1 peptidyl-arginine deiminase [Bacteroidales bacterium]
MKKLVHFLFLSSILIFSQIVVFGQEEKIMQSSLTHWMTPDELLRKNEIGKGFVPTAPPVWPVISVAEFMPAEGVLVRYPFGIPMSLIKDLSFRTRVTTIVKNSSQQSTVAGQYSANGVNVANCDYLLANSDSYWTRDYGPWYVIDSSYEVGIVDFPYNRPRPNDDEIAKLVAGYQGIEWYGMDVTHTGGNYMSNGMGQASSTELVYEENQGTSTATIAQRMHDYLGIEQYLVRPDPNNTYIDHIDCWAKFLDVDKILVRSVPTSHPQYSSLEEAAAFWTSTTSSYGTPYQVFRVNTPNDEPYTNSLILNKTVYLPIKGTANDQPAKEAYEAAMPGYEVLTYLQLGSAPWESTDALHCRTHEMADRGMLLIRHNPILTSRPSDEDYQLPADIVALSDSGFYADSLFVRYRVNNGNWQQTGLIWQQKHQWLGVIPRQAEGSVIDYYIHAADSSGRSENHPYIGAPDPHRFTVGPAIHPHILINTVSIDTFAYPGNATTSKISMTNTGSATLSYTLSADEGCTWMNIPDPQGTIGAGNTGLVDIIFNSAGLVNGVYHTYLYVASNDPDKPADSIAITFAVGDPAGINQLQADGLKLWISPNPFTNYIRLTVESDFAEQAAISVFTTGGQPVFSSTVELHEGINQINLNSREILSLRAGIYLMNIRSGDQVVYRRLVKLD